MDSLENNRCFTLSTAQDLHCWHQWNWHLTLALVTKRLDPVELPTNSFGGNRRFNSVNLIVCIIICYTNCLILFFCLFSIFVYPSAQSPALDPLQQAYTGMQHYTGEASQLLIHSSWDLSAVKNVKYNTVVLLFSEKTPAWTIKKIQKQQVKYNVFHIFFMFLLN